VDPALYDNGYDLALADEELGRLPEARRQIQPLLQRKDTAELHSLLAEVEEKAGDYVLAANEYEKVAHLDPSESNLFDWGSELLAHQTAAPATEVFSEGLKRYPNSSRLAIGLGLALYLRGRYDEAVPEYQLAFKLSPKTPDAHFRLGQAYVHLGKQELAEKEFQLHKVLYEQHLAEEDK
jgi:Flp pilus assembly protein TadD